MAITTIKEAKLFLQKGMNNKDGCQCPACGQTVKFQRRRLSKNMAIFLFELAEISGAFKNGYQNSEAVYYKDCQPKGKDYQELSYWGLIELGEKRGYWKITGWGLAFLRNRRTVKSIVLIYDKKVRGYSGKDVSIIDIAGIGIAHNVPGFREDK